MISLLLYDRLTSFSMILLNSLELDNDDEFKESFSEF